MSILSDFLGQASWWSIKIRKFIASLAFQIHMSAGLFPVFIRNKRLLFGCILQITLILKEVYFHYSTPHSLNTSAKHEEGSATSRKR